MIDDILKNPNKEFYWLRKWTQMGGTWANYKGFEKVSSRDVNQQEWENYWFTFDMMKDHFKSEVVAEAYRTKHQATASTWSLMQLCQNASRQCAIIC